MDFSEFFSYGHLSGGVCSIGSGLDYITMRADLLK